MELLSGLWTYIVPFLIVLTILVFVHELGHYLVARRNGVRVDVFSIGFGPELFGFYDRAGTRWKFSAIPLGGYVKMFGDADAASTPVGSSYEMTEEEKAVSFPHKRLGQRAAVVAAGPVANFLFAIVALALLFVFQGQPFTPAEVGVVQPGSAAEAAGIQPGDRILSVDGSEIGRFEDVQQIVRFNTGEPLAMVVERDGEEVALTATPAVTEVTDRLGNTHSIGMLGIGRSGVEYRRLDPFSAVWAAGAETVDLTLGTLGAVGQMLAGARGTEELGGPLRIAQMSGEVAQSGAVALIWFMAILSINLGLINLFPIPMLDGGHLMFYAVEALRGKPLGERAQEYGFRIGLALVLTLMVFATWNDLVHLRVVDFFRGLIS
jgi:regulator of sigma E protease